MGVRETAVPYSAHATSPANDDSHSTPYPPEVTEPVPAAVQAAPVGVPEGLQTMNAKLRVSTLKQEISLLEERVRFLSEELEEAHRTGSDAMLNLRQPAAYRASRLSSTTTVPRSRSTTPCSGRWATPSAPPIGSICMVTRMPSWRPRPALSWPYGVPSKCAMSWLRSTWNRSGFDCFTTARAISSPITAHAKARRSTAAWKSNCANGETASRYRFIGGGNNEPIIASTHEACCRARERLTNSAAEPFCCPSLASHRRPQHGKRIQYR